MIRSLVLACLNLMVMAGFALEPAVNLSVIASPEGDFAGTIEALVWRIDGSLELQARSPDGKVLSVKLKGVRLVDVPADRLSGFTGERRFSPEGPSLILRFHDAESQPVGVLAIGFRYRYPIVGVYRMGFGKILSPAGVRTTGAQACTIRLIPPAGESIEVTPLIDTFVDIAGTAWKLRVLRAETVMIAPKTAGDQGTGLHIDFYAFEKN